MSRHLMSSRLFFFLRWLLMRCLLMRNLLTFSTKKSHMSRYLKSSLLTSLYRFIHQDARRLLMSDLFVEKVSRLLMSRHLMSSHLKKKMRWLLMRCLLTTTWTGLLSAPSMYQWEGISRVAISSFSWDSYSWDACSWGTYSQFLQKSHTWVGISRAAYSHHYRGRSHST